MQEWKIIQNPKNLLCGMTYEQVVEALKKNGLALQFVPEALRTAALCEIAVQHNGFVLRYVPMALRTAQLCEIAVEKDGWALLLVPDEHKHLFNYWV